MLNDIILLLILLMLSAFFSGSELAFVIANKIKIEVKARKNNLPAKSAQYFVQNQQEFFSSILVVNNIVNIAFASLSAVLLGYVFGLKEWEILIITTFVILLFGELLPKYFAREIADRLVFLTSLPIRVVSFFLYPVIKILSSISDKISGASNVSEENIINLFSKDDVETLVKESHDAGAVDKKESDIISKVLDLGGQRVYEAMRPRTEIAGVEINSDVEEILNVFIETGYSKLPVFEDSLDNIKGVVLAYDFFKSPSTLSQIIREVIFVPETKKSIDMLNEFLDKQASFAVVVDEFGGTAGIVTMEDIIEELFGEIKDEYDVDEDICKSIGKNIYMISGRVEVDHINEKYQLNIPSGPYETIAGYITSKIGRLPQEGENIVIDNFSVLIVRARTTKIEMVKLIVSEE